MNTVEYAKSLVELQLADVQKWVVTDRKDLLEAALERLAEATKRYEAAIADEAQKSAAEAAKATEAAEAAAAEAAAVAAATAAAAKRCTGPLVESYSTGTTHFVNDWNETYCGRYNDGSYAPAGHGRATCGTCRIAGDAALREGFPMSGGSAARR